MNFVLAKGKKKYIAWFISRSHTFAMLLPQFLRRKKKRITEQCLLLSFPPDFLCHYPFRSTLPAHWKEQMGKELPLLAYSDDTICILPTSVQELQQLRKKTAK